MSQAVYERYKDALRRGHVAALRGQVEAALEAYDEAAAVAPERALPHVGIGGLYLRVGRASDALIAYDAALARAARDEGALAGRADALVALGRPVEAAAALELLAQIREDEGRSLEALRAAVQGLGLAESRDRRRLAARLAERIRAAEPEDQADAVLAEAVLAEADRLLEVAPAPVDGGVEEPAAPRTAGAAAQEPTEAPSGPTADQVAPPAPPDPVERERAAEAAAGSGDRAAARAALLEAAEGYARDRREDAALDACYRALALGPDDPAVHLALARRYRRRGWSDLADQKLELLGRLAELRGDERTGEAVAALRGAGAEPGPSTG